MIGAARRNRAARRPHQVRQTTAWPGFAALGDLDVLVTDSGLDDDTASEVEAGPAIRVVRA